MNSFYSNEDTTKAICLYNDQIEIYKFNQSCFRTNKTSGDMDKDTLIYNEKKLLYSEMAHKHKNYVGTFNCV